MLKKMSAVGLAASVEIGNEEQDGKKIQIKNWDEKKPIQKSRKSQQMVKSKKWIQAKKSEASRAKNFNSQSEFFLTSEARKPFIKLRQAFVGVSILNHFYPECHIQIKINTSGYAIGGIFNQLTLDDLSQ